MGLPLSQYLGLMGFGGAVLGVGSRVLDVAFPRKGDNYIIYTLDSVKLKTVNYMSS